MLEKIISKFVAAKVPFGKCFVENRDLSIHQMLATLIYVVQISNFQAFQYL